MTEHVDQMKDFIQLTEHFVRLGMDSVPVVESEEMIQTESPDKAVALVNEMRDVIFKLRAHLEEDANSEYALGVEAGMRRASEMIENVLSRILDAGSDHGELLG